MGKIRLVLSLSFVLLIVQTINASIQGRLLTPQEGCGQIDPVKTTRIVGGAYAIPNSYPWMALLMMVDRNTTQFHCGGSLITSRHVLTAAHCINSQLSAVRLGEHQISSNSDVSHEDVRVIRVDVHPYYNAEAISDGIAILTLERDVTFTNRVRPICLIQGQSYSYNDYKEYAAGWGLTKEKGTQSDVLKTLQVTVVSNEKCEMLYRRQIAVRPNQFDGRVVCAGCLEGGQGCCQGDSGGPLMLPFSVNGKFPIFQIGVVSYGVGCARKDVPGVFTRVQTYNNWIQSVISK